MHSLARLLTRISTLRLDPAPLRHLAFFLAVLAFVATDAPGVFAQSHGDAWCNVPGTRGYAGTCRSSGSSGGTRTIVIEREVEIILGPPVIVWKLPSAEGATGSQFNAISNPNMQGSLAGEMMTPTMYHSRARRAVRDGDYAKALGYLQAALQQNPSPNEIDAILKLKAEAQREFDAKQGAGFKFNKSDRQTELLTIDVDGVPDSILGPLLDRNRTDKGIEEARRTLFPLFAEQAAMKKRLDELKGMKIEDGRVQAAQADLNKAKATVRKEVEKKKPIIMQMHND